MLKRSYNPNAKVNQGWNQLSFSHPPYIQILMGTAQTPVDARVIMNDHFTRCNRRTYMHIAAAKCVRGRVTFTSVILLVTERPCLEKSLCNIARWLVGFGWRIPVCQVEIRT